MPNNSPWQNKQDRIGTRSLKREAVLRTAAQVFNEKGFQAATLDEVAARLNVSKPTLYYYVKNKDEILFECVRIGLTMLRDEIRAVAASGGNAAERLVAAMRKYAEIVTMDFGMCVIRVGEDPLPAAARVKLRRMKAALDHEFRALIRQGIEEGSMRDCDPKLAAFTIAGALSWIGRWYRPDGELRGDEIGEQIIVLLVRGLCAGGPLETPKSAPRSPATRRRAAAMKAAT